MAEVSHTHPHGDQSVRTMYRQGTPIAADGGRSETEEDRRTMADVDHEPPEGVDGAARTYARGPTET